MNNFIYVNKEVSLPNNYIPPDLVDVESKYKDGIKLNDRVYHWWLKLKKDIESKGYFVEIESGYRSYDYQKKILDELTLEKGAEYASAAIAKPGHSEHQTGLSLDYCVLRDNIFIDTDGSDNIALLSDCDECKYINSVAHRYGFIVRYPKGKEHITGYKYEPWHLRYVGKKLATYLYKNKLTLDEYYMRRKEEKNE